MNGRINVLLVLLPLLPLGTAFSPLDDIEPHFTNTNCGSEPEDNYDCATRMHLGSAKDGGNKVSGHRYPQIPLEVEGYPVAPDGLQLEQVHVYVRHGAPISNYSIYNIHYMLHTSRGTHPSWRTHVGTSSQYTRTLDDVQYTS